MPINNTGQGNSLNTAIKQIALGHVFKVHARIVECIHRKYRSNGWAYDPHYVYIDLNAGTGTNDDGRPGSPVIAQRVIAEEFKHDLSGVAIEQNEEAFSLLSQAMTGFQGWQLIQGDNNEKFGTQLLPSPGKSPFFGLVYADPNGVKDRLPLPAMTQFFRQYNARKLDVLIHISATALKRVKGAGTGTEDLQSIMAAIRKDCWFIRDSFGPWQWTFLFGTNWYGWPELNLRVDGIDIQNIYQLGLRRIRSPEGQAIFSKLFFTHAQQKKRLMPLPIDPTVSIYDIQNSLPFEPKL